MLGYNLALAAPEVLPESSDFTMLGQHCTIIDGTHNRGIKVSQLQLLQSFLKGETLSSAGWLPWMDRAPPQYSATAGQRLNASTINLYQLADWVISACADWDIG